MKKKHVLLILVLLLTTLQLTSMIGSSYGAIDEECNGECPQNYYDNKFKISDSNGEMYFYPGGMVATEIGGIIRLDYNGKYLEWGILQSFYNVSFYYADNSLNASFSNISESVIGMNMIWGFGGFSPNLQSDTDWDAQDANARSVADAANSETWPALNGELNISSEYGRHTYNYTQNPTNGTQRTYLVYDETSGLLLSFASNFEGYNLSARLLIGSPLEFKISDSNGKMHFYPGGVVATEIGGTIRLDYNGDYSERGVLQSFYNVSFYYADNTLNASFSNVSESTIGMNMIWGFGGFTPNLQSDTDWDYHDSNARSVADAPNSEVWPAMNGELIILSEFGRHIYDYTQNPSNGTQRTYLVYDETSGLLISFASNFEGYNLSASLLIDSLDKKSFIPGFNLAGIVLIFLGILASLSVIVSNRIKFNL